MPKQKPINTAEALRRLSQGLRLQAVRPNIYAYKPHSHQLEFHKSLARGRQFIGGNRSGKTVGGATEAIWWAGRNHPYRSTTEEPVRGRIVSVDFLNGVQKIVMPEVARWMPPSLLLEGSWEKSYNKELRTLYLADGGFIEFMSYDQDLEKFAGTSRHFIWFDEEPPEDIFNECKMRLIDVGGSWWMTMTPVEGMSWTYDNIYLAARSDPNLFVVQVSMDDNPYISSIERDVALSGLSEDEKKARRHGKYIEREGLIYKMFKPEIHVIKPFAGGPPKDWLRFTSMDHGFNNPTAWLWFTVNRDGSLFVFDEHYESGQVVSYHAQVVHEMEREHGRQPDYRVGDPSIGQVNPITGTSVQIEYVEHGLPILNANNDVKSGINRVARYLEGINGVPRLYITRNCENLVREIQRLRWASWATKKMQRDRNRKEEQHKKDDHACDALRYGVASRPQTDDGTEIKRNFDESLAPAGVDIYKGRVDDELARLGKGRDVVSTSKPDYVTTTDFNLGAEY